MVSGYQLTCPCCSSWLPVNRHCGSLVTLGAEWRPGVSCEPPLSLESARAALKQHVGKFFCPNVFPFGNHQANPEHWQKGCPSHTRAVNSHWQTESSGSRGIWEGGLGSHRSTSGPSNALLLGSGSPQGAMKTDGGRQGGPGQRSGKHL